MPSFSCKVRFLPALLLIRPLLFMLSRYSAKLTGYSRLLVAPVCITVALVWSGQRPGLLLQDFI